MSGGPNPAAILAVRPNGYITRPQLWALDEACKSIAEVFGPPYLVGSVTERPTFRDVDVRLILDDDEYDTLSDEAWGLFGFVTSRHLAAVTGLPIDFQIQRRTEANAAYAGKSRNPLGLRTLDHNWIGDQRPTRAAVPSEGEDGWVEAMRQQQRVEAALLVAAEWDRDAEAYLNRVGQPLYGSVALLAEMLRKALA